MICNYQLNQTKFVVLRNFLLAYLLLVFPTTYITAQDTQVQLCSNIDALVIQPINPVKFNRKEFYEDECNFEFTITDKSYVTISVEKFKTEKESRQSIRDSVYLFRIEDNLKTKKELIRKRLKNEGNWSDIFFFQSNNNNDSFMLLRKQKYEIVLFAKRIETIIEIEKLMRKVEFKRNLSLK